MGENDKFFDEFHKKDNIIYADDAFQKMMEDGHIDNHYVYTAPRYSSRCTGNRTERTGPGTKKHRRLPGCP